MLKQVQHDENKRHPELVSGSHGLEYKDEMLKRVQYDENKRHAEFSSGSDDIENKDKMLKQVQHDGMNDEMLKRVQHDGGIESDTKYDTTNRHAEFSSGSYDLEHKDKMLKQVQHDGMSRGMLKQE